MSGRLQLDEGWWNALCASSALQWRVLSTRAMGLVSGVINPLMFVAILMVPRRDALTPADATRVVTGILLGSLWAASMWSAMGILRRERQDGTLAATVTGVHSPLVVLLGKIAAAVILDAALIGVTTAAAVFLLRVSPAVGDVWAFAVGIATVAVAGVCAALLVGSALVVSKHGFELTAALGPPILLLGGMIVPLSALPDWLAWPGLGLNLRWVQEFLASAASGTTNWTALIIALALSALYAFAGVALFRCMLTKAKREATLDLV